MQAMQAFFSSMGMDAFLQGHVPQDASMPYLMYEVKQGGFGEEAEASAEMWFDGDTANAERAVWAGKMEALLPEGGAKMETSQGMMVLYRGKEFLTLEEKTDVPCCGVRVNFLMKWYGET